MPSYLLILFTMLMPSYISESWFCRGNHSGGGWRMLGESHSGGVMLLWWTCNIGRWICMVAIWWICKIEHSWMCKTLVRWISLHIGEFGALYCCEYCFILLWILLSILVWILLSILVWNLLAVKKCWRLCRAHTHGKGASIFSQQADFTPILTAIFTPILTAI